jgi:hypothetical protein
VIVVQVSVQAKPDNVERLQHLLRQVVAQKHVSCPAAGDTTGTDLLMTSVSSSSTQSLIPMRPSRSIERGLS